ncbi:RNA-binding cell elongation regulator Jag/EloR [Calorimonas adulescens]|uniref:RNA-binding protein KhpB n=1 Tax=Calorimonas adulescens TaxID=2606906 RepID=A0A5D8Q7Z5_9THEO|nr:RNA-binding cell elongation regulator Jag/EloR [Calorimonas adulescens]TZE80760.1 protein jag [Calorimonas adulescens]
MKSVEKSGKNVDEAIKAALDELGADVDDVNIEILDEGSKGLFGFGSRGARVRVVLKYDPEKEVKRFLRDILRSLNLNVDFLIDYSEIEGTMKIEFFGTNVGFVIGHRGDVLNSLQYLTYLVANKERTTDKQIHVILDAENYRERRETTLRNLANRMAKRAVSLHKNVVLEPMTPYERKIIHETLQNHPAVETYSIGEDPHRKVVIALKK